MDECFENRSRAVREAAERRPKSECPTTASSPHPPGPFNVTMVEGHEAEALLKREEATN
jgi:hypothetical protein